MRITGNDRRQLRELARAVAEAAADPIHQQRVELWRDHNDLKPGRPLVLIFPEGAWREMLPMDTLVCTPGPARDLEYDLRVRLYYREHLDDDNVIESIVGSPIITHSTGWGIENQVQRPEEATGAFHIEPVIKSEHDIDKIHTPEITIDWQATEERFAGLNDLLGDILTVEKQGWTNPGIAPLDHYATLRGIDQLFLDLVDNPEMVHKAVGRLVDGHIAMIRSLEQQGGLTLGNRRHYTGSGGTGYTRQLPGPDFDGVHVRAKDIWGFATAQIFSEVSPAMHEEFALRHEMRFLELFGLNCYGCCEPLHRKLDLVKTIPRLRRISISPWADAALSAESLGDRYIFSWKPNPAVVAAEKWNPDAVRAELRTFLQTTRGCVVEMIMKDTHTCRNEPWRMHDWVRIAREEAEAAG